MLRGIPVSPGIAVAHAYCVDEVLAPRDPLQIDASELSAEIRRFEDACQAAAKELDAIVERVSAQLGEGEAAIFRAHRMLLRDPALIGKVRAAIMTRSVDAQTALHAVLEEYTALFDKIQDEFFKERLADVRDVVGRIMAQLSLGRHSATRWLQLSLVVDSEAIKRRPAQGAMRRPPFAVTTETASCERSSDAGSPASRVNSAIAPKVPKLQPASMSAS